MALNTTLADDYKRKVIDLAAQTAGLKLDVDIKLPF